MASKKFGTLDISDRPWTRTLSKRFSNLPDYAPNSMTEAYRDVKNDDRVDRIVITCYQEITPNQDIFNHLTIKIYVWDDDDRRNLAQKIQSGNDLYFISSNHACKYHLHDMPDYGKYQNYLNKTMCVMEFIMT
jgi:hypothetical protein